MDYITRVTDAIIEKKLQGLGGLMIVGPKWCGKTSTAEQFSNSAIYLDDFEDGGNNIQIAALNPAVLLEGESPRLVDEWQLAPNLFDAAHRGEPSFLAVITGGKYPYMRDDGVFVIPVGCLAP